MTVRLSAYKLTMIQVGGLICMPSLLAGYVLAQSYGLGSALGALLIGNLLLSALSLWMLKLTMAARLTTAEYVSALFGPLGEKACAFAYLVALTGWFAVNQNFMMQQLAAIFPHGSLMSLLGSILCGGVCTYCVLKGVKKLEALSEYTVPLMLLVIAMIVVQVLNNQSIAPAGGLPTGAGILLVVNMSLVMVFDIPTYYRFSEDYRSGAVSLLVLFLLCAPLVQGVGVLLGAAQLDPDTQLFEFIKADGVLLNVLYGAFFLFAGLTTNSANLYSAVANAKALLPIGWGPRTLLLGGVGTLLSFMDLLGHFELTLIGITHCMLVLGVGVLVLYTTDPDSLTSSLSQKRRAFLKLAIAVVAASMAQYIMPINAWIIYLFVAFRGLLAFRAKRGESYADTTA